MNDLEKRMYFFVPYNISPIQQAIQAGHAAIEYSRKYKDSELFIDFADNWKTWIILNGGTTNNNINRGLLEIAHLSPFRCGEIDHSLFYEPDLNDALTAICFIADERVFNYEDYPDFNYFTKEYLDDIEWLKYFKNGPEAEEKAKEEYKDLYNKWVDSLGGQNNVFLRELLKGKKLA